METSTKVAIAGGGSIIIAGLAYVFKTSGVRNRIASLAAATVSYSRDHAINKMVSQGRAFSKGYSSCGDLWNYVLDKIGAPDSWVNRTSEARGMKWKVAVNISKPWGAALKSGAAVKWKPGLLPNKGDLVLIGKEPAELAHVFVVLGRSGKTIMTAEYGGANNSSRMGSRTIHDDGTITPDMFKRHVVGWIDAEKIPRS